MANTETFPQWLQRQLDRREWRQVDLARRADVSGTSVSHYLNGNRIPDPMTCDRIADALAVDRDLVLALAGHRPPDQPLDPDDPITILLGAAKKIRWTPERLESILVVLRMYADTDRRLAEKDRQADSRQ